MMELVRAVAIVVAALVALPFVLIAAAFGAFEDERGYYV